VLTYPIDVVRGRLTADDGRKYGGSIGRCVRATVQEPAGLRGLYRGMVPTLFAVGPFLAIQQAVSVSNTLLVNRHI
jgi:hypothetical protein